jgi:hypothetical protein
MHTTALVNIRNSPNELLPLTRILLADRRATYLPNTGVTVSKFNLTPLRYFILFYFLFFFVTPLRWVHPSSKEMYKILEDDIGVLRATP